MVCRLLDGYPKQQKICNGIKYVKYVTFKKYNKNQGNNI